MAKREATQQLNVRVRESTLFRLRDFLESQYPQPPAGQVVDVAINEYLNKAGAPQTHKPHKPK